MTDELSAILAQALRRLETGEPVEACLSRFSDHAGQLAPLLRTAAWTMEVLAYAEAPSETTLAAGRQRFLAAAAASPPVTPMQPSRSQLPALWRWLTVRPLAALVLVVLALVFAGSGAVIASAQSLPGDPLYPIKRTTEEVRLLLAPDPETRAELQAELDEVHREEARVVAASHRYTQVSFRGPLEHIGEDAWTVGGLVIALDRTTRIDGEPAPGLIVAVEAVTQGDGVIYARHLQILPPPAPGLAHPTRTQTPATSTTLAITTTPTPQAAGGAPISTAMPETIMPVSPTGLVVSPSMTPEGSNATATPRLLPPLPQHTLRPGIIATLIPQPEPTRTPRPTRTLRPLPLPRPTDKGGPGPTSSPPPAETEAPEPTRGPHPTFEPTRRPDWPPLPTRLPDLVPTLPHEHTPHPTRDKHEPGAPQLVPALPPVSSPLRP